MGYIIKNGYYQADLLWRRVPLNKMLEDPNIAPETKKKLTIAQDAKSFAQDKLGLAKTDNYDSFVQLKDRYVTYAVSAAPPYELKHYLWSFPLVGELPYKGFFVKEQALNEQEELKREGFDTYVRGVTAYSTLGWFDDPLLSSMLAYDDYELVNVVIHESVHATIYIPSQADFNERLATFLGNKGTEAYYVQKEGAQSPTIEKIKNENHDDFLFSQFLAGEVKALKEWYATAQVLSPESKSHRLREVSLRFDKSVKPKLKGSGYKKFGEIELNNAVLLSYNTYFNDLSDFEKLYQILDSDFHKLMEFCKSLEKEPDPQAAVKKKILN